MIICIANVLDATSLGKVRSLIDAARFEDGRTTAGWHARLVKENRQAARCDPATREAAEIVTAALMANEVFRSAVRPLRMRPPLLARYGVGETYGTHVDDAVMGLGDPGGPLRTDVAVTVFLADPATYEGGALVMEDPAGEQEFRLGAGDAIAYPATTLHRVEAVTAGERIVAVTWVQSLVRDPAKREILFDLETAKRRVFSEQGKGETFDLLAKSHANLLRQWVET